MSEARELLWVLWPEDIEPLQLRGVGRTRWTNSIIKHLHQLPLIKALDFANREDANAGGLVADDLLDEFGSDEQPIEDERLNIPQKLDLAEFGKDGAERVGVDTSLCCCTAAQRVPICSFRTGERASSAGEVGEVEVAKNERGVVHEISKRGGGRGQRGERGERQIGSSAIQNQGIREQVQ
jgi:hypothetical protein